MTCIAKMSIWCANDYTILKIDSERNLFRIMLSRFYISMLKLYPFCLIILYQRLIISLNNFNFKNFKIPQNFQTWLKHRLTTKSRKIIIENYFFNIDIVIYLFIERDIANRSPAIFEAYIFHNSFSKVKLYVVSRHIPRHFTRAII